MDWLFLPMPPLGLPINTLSLFLSAVSTTPVCPTEKPIYATPRPRPAAAGCMVHLNALELTAPRREFFFPVPALARCLHDPRDAPVLYLFANILCYLALALPLLLRFRDSHLAGAAYFGALFALFFERFILALHFHAHRPLTTHPLLNEVPQYLLAPLFGIPPGVYAAHHTIMHHVEGNVFPRDLSSTECYDRGSPAHFVAYWARFLFLSAIELPWYAAAKQRYALAAHLLASFAGTGVAYSAAYAASPVLATWTLLVPLVVGSFLLMLGNWSQHIFINPADPSRHRCIAFPSAREAPVHRLSVCAREAVVPVRVFTMERQGT